MALILSLTLGFATLATTAHRASATPVVGGDGGDEGIGTAGGSGGTPSPVPGPGNVGDPDSPQNGYKQVIKGTAQRSASATMRTEGDGRRVEMSWMWRLQVVLKAMFGLRFTR